MNNKRKAYLALLATWFLVFATQESLAQLIPVTPHDLLPEARIEVEDAELPQWKALWDAARQSALQGDFEAAIRQYRGLLILKGNLAEARWELARIMTYLQRWDEAVELLELLVETEPENLLYLKALGKVMVETAQYERAVALFRRVHDKDGTDQTALAGLVEGLTRLDRNNEALPYLEQLTRQEPTNRGVRRYLAFMLYEAGDYEKAREQLTVLSRNEDAEPEVLYKTAKTYARLGLDQQASSYWERYLAREPENIEAHMFLAQYYEKSGELERALTHLEALLANNPDDPATYLRLGNIYEMAGELDYALAFYEKYLARFPGDPNVLKRLAGVNETLLRQRQAQASFRQKVPVDNREQIESLRVVISRLEAAGHYQEALPFYRQLMALSPGDQETLGALADNLVATAEKQSKVTMPDFLGGSPPDNMTVYRAMAGLLRQMGREEELLSVLQRMHELEPDDTPVTRELAIIYLKRGDLLLSRTCFAELADAGCQDGLCLEARADLADKLDLPVSRLHDLETLLQLQPGRNDIRMASVALAAGMGLLDTAVYHAGYLQIMPDADNNLELKILLAEAYRVSGYAFRAARRYRNIIEQTAGREAEEAEALRIRSRLGLAESYLMLGLDYEAEQTLREGLVLERNRSAILAELFHLYLRTGRITESEIWLQALDQEVADPQGENGAGPFQKWHLEFFQAEMYGAAGDYDLAADLFRQAESIIPAEDSDEDGLHAMDDGSPRYQVQIHLATSLLHLGEYAEAERLVLELQQRRAPKLESLVLLRQIYLSWGKGEKAAVIAAETAEYTAQDFGRLLELARLSKKYMEPASQSAAAAAAAARMPESLAAQHLHVEAEMQVGEHQVSMALLRQLLESYPDNTLFLSRQAELLAKVGRFQEALAAAEMLRAENPERPDVVLLQARIFWELNRWKAAIAQYESITEPPVTESLEQDVSRLQLTVEQSPSRGSWWNKVTFSEGEPVSISEMVLSPQHAADFSAAAQAANSVAVPYYALYRWQDRFSKELSVRRAVMRREYYHAANKLEKVIEEFGANDFLLYDLAGLYSRLERLSDEAVIYRELAGSNADFPGLADAVQRNNLKRRPKVFLAYVMQEDDGWEEYKAMRQKIIKGGTSYYQTTDQKLDFDLARIKYESTLDTRHIMGWRAMLHYEAKLSQAFGLTLGGGYEKLESGYDGTPLLYGAVTGKIADEMRAVFSAKQDVEADTIASLTRNIKRRDYKLELMFDLFPRLLLGGYYDFVNYSDSNWMNNYTFWASYIILPEPSLLKISYNYEFFDSHEGQKPGPPGDDGYAPDDHPYWCPVNYWVTRFSLYFKQQLSNDTLARGVPSYFTLEYSLGYDAEDNDLHEIKGSINVELAKKIVLSGSYGFLDMGVYQQQQALVSVMYRF